MHREDVKAAIRKAYGTIEKFAAAQGLRDSSVYHALRPPNKLEPKSEPTDRVIATFLGEPLHVVFPDRYKAPLTTTTPNTRRLGNGTSV
ncbi:helix-turn-helix domain-containing protein [Anthocerotibacter panamensis]|uniref:helix-turn-helix domain-containing protein n=1 Tax=Anthocerotibacter panamensis TaxID=2857077 RepID=UPI001C4020EC